MRCIFCKKSTHGSSAVEHVIPESLGNTDHILPTGIVCDGCNNYFSRRIEGPLLNSIGFRNQRAGMGIASKRGNIPPQRGLIPQLGIEVDIGADGEGGFHITAARGRDESRLIEYCKSGVSGRIHVPLGGGFSTRLFSRFLGKVGLEAFSAATLGVNRSNAEVVEHEQLDDLRAYVRYDKGDDWPFTTRILYPADNVFSDGHEILHEYDVLITERSGIYVVLCLFGIEYALNLGGRSLIGYQTWLDQHDGKSPLYCDWRAELSRFDC